ncbi:metal ABC transporter substrate-binding protein [Microbulbifer elongatus]|uniref:metal ABC transporter substrate-binding protein n=1 Tax=Microbulbifer elongatus TaxID=86173 RepID=UPI001E4E6350|nr:metal ABC transporter substrate-binding protein [Microbulbifer elongatus]
MSRQLMSEIVLRLLSVLMIVVTSLVATGGCAPREPDEAAAGPKVVASIGPLAMIAREVAGDQASVHQLIRNGDPHHFAPKVSDRMGIEAAQLVVWMGPAMESVLARQMALVPDERQLVLLADETAYEYAGADAADPHLWLRPRNAAVMAAMIATRLATADPEHAEDYRQRARDFSRAMANLQKVQDRALWAYKDAPIVTTHQAYSHFFGAAGVAVESLGAGSGHQHGARTLVQKRRALDEDPSAVVGCLFGEAPANDRDRQTATNLNLGYQALDPLGITMAEGASYRDLMEKLLADARLCLARIPDRSAQ